MRTIRRYANRKMYDATNTTYVNNGHILQFIKEGVEFSVVDAVTGADLTANVIVSSIINKIADKRVLAENLKTFLKSSNVNTQEESNV